MCVQNAIKIDLPLPDSFWAITPVKIVRIVKINAMAALKSILEVDGVSEKQLKKYEFCEMCKIYFYQVLSIWNLEKLLPVQIISRLLSFSEQVYVLYI